MGANDSRSQSCDRKSKIGLRHAIKLDQLSCMTLSSNNTYLFQKPNFPGGLSQKSKWTHVYQALFAFPHFGKYPAVQRCKTMYWSFRSLLHWKMETEWLWRSILIWEAHKLVCQVYSTLQNWLLCIWSSEFCMKIIVYLVQNLLRLNRERRRKVKILKRRLRKIAI